MKIRYEIIGKRKVKPVKNITSENYRQFTMGRWPVVSIEDMLDDKIKSPNVNRVIGQPLHLGFAANFYVITRGPGIWDKYQKSKAETKYYNQMHTSTPIDLCATEYAIDAVTGIVITLDNKIIAEKRSNKVANNPSGISLPAGACNYREHPVSTLKRELYEELNLKPKYIKLQNENPLTIVNVPQSLTFNYVYVVNTPLTFEKICKQARNAEDNWEWQKLISVPYDAKSIRKFAMDKINGKSSRVALLAFADYLDGEL